MSLIRYDTICLSMQDLQPAKTKSSHKNPSRLKLLRRTLRERNVLAKYVHELRVLDVDQTLPHLQQSDALSDLLASIVMACPNLECLTGLYPTYTHSFTRLSHALSTRSSLKSHVWTFGPTDNMWNGVELRIPRGWLRPTLVPDQLQHFLGMHSQWTRLDTLVMRANEDSVLTQVHIFRNVLALLPSLRHLYISDFSPDDFNDQHLQSIATNLESLRLENLPGLSEDGLMSFFARSQSAVQRRCLRNLSLINLRFCSIANLASLFNLLNNLDRFTLVTSSLFLPLDVSPDELEQPALSCPSLRHLHWEISNLAHPPSKSVGPAIHLPHYLLADSVIAEGFPCLTRLRVPLDPLGILQAVCRPIAEPVHLMLDSNSECFIQPRRQRHVDIFARAPLTPNEAAIHAYDRAARAMTPRAQQSRLHPAFRRSYARSGDPSTSIYVWNATGRLIDIVECPAFLGTVGPGTPEYVLIGDGRDGEEWLAGFQDLTMPGRTGLDMKMLF